MILHALFSKKTVFNQTRLFLDFFFGDLPLGRHQLFLRDNLGNFLNMWLMGLMAYPMDDICVWSLFDVFWALWPTSRLFRGKSLLKLH